MNKKEIKRRIRKRYDEIERDFSRIRFLRKLLKDLEKVEGDENRI